MQGILAPLGAARRAGGLCPGGFGPGAQAVTRSEWLSTLAGGGGVMVWVASALAVAALGYALTRVIEEI